MYKSLSCPHHCLDQVISTGKQITNAAVNKRNKPPDHNVSFWIFSSFFPPYTPGFSDIGNNTKKLEREFPCNKSCSWTTCSVCWIRKKHRIPGKNYWRYLTVHMHFSFLVSTTHRTSQHMLLDDFLGQPRYQ